MTTHAPTGPAAGPPAPPRIPPPPAASNTTRHLCAGAYLDEEFQRACLAEVYGRRAHLIAPSYGFDLVTVLGQCLQARQITILRDAMTLVLLVPLACVAPLGTGFAIIGLLLIYLVTSIQQIIENTARELRQGQSASSGIIFSRAMAVLFRLLGAVIVLNLLGRFMDELDDSSRTGSYSGGYPESPLVGIFPGFVMALLVMFGPPVVASLARQSQLNQFAPGRTPAPPARSKRFDEIRRQESGNTIAFSGPWPFIGSGSVLTNWGFAQRLVRAGNPLTGLAPETEREFPTAPFSAAELVAHLRGELSTLARAQEAEQQLAGLTVVDRVVLAGTEVGHLAPYTDPAHLLAIIRQPTASARHYLVCQVVSWHGELVTTVYVHVAVQGRSLYMGFTSTALPPCDERFRVIDQVGETGAAAYLRAGVRGLLDAPTTIVRAPLNLARNWGGSLKDSSWFKFNESFRRGYDHGARVSVRELAMAADTRHHLQTQEIDKYQRIIERRLLAAALDFLESRGVDTSEYRQRATVLLNAAAIVSGGHLVVHGDVNSTQTNTADPWRGTGR
ncbi:hypothetical protein [Micromonospora sp. NBC_01412]|uniref:hypothetical protein n=1 Tax=Micromonospora sp. NBC_01412 TaxID=2903590 RepID=UPI00324AF923